jgi:hypothetical protein
MQHAKLGAALAVAIIGASTLVRCGPEMCPSPPLSQCPSFIADFVAPCGFKSFTSTCSPTADCSVDMSGCAIRLTRTQTCDATIILGDETVHTAHLVITQPPPPDAGRCYTPCAQPPSLILTVDGEGKPSIVDFTSATCVGSDAGTDTSADVATD